jgi:hypothetical protein
MNVPVASSGEPTREQWNHRPGDLYVVAIGHAWMNPTGFGIDYERGNETHERLGDAISEGFGLVESDDFNIAVLRGGEVKALLWMDEVTDDEPEFLATIASVVR